MRWYFLFAIIATVAAVAVFYPSVKNNPFPFIKSASSITPESLLRLKNYSNELSLYANVNGYNTHYCFLIDMKIPSGKKRFFVYNLKGDSIAIAGMVTHGSGSTYSAAIVFSNEPGSNCSSTGKYKIGQSYNGKFGLAYKLQGLDATNSNAYKRFVVLHAHPSVPTGEVAPQKICTSWGCPTVSPAFLQQLKLYLDKPGKPILLWIYN